MDKVAENLAGKETAGEVETESKPENETASATENKTENKTENETEKVENGNSAEENLFKTLHPKGSLNDRLYFNPNRMLVRPDLHLKRVLIKVFAVLVIAVVCAYLSWEYLKEIGTENFSLYAWLIGAGIVLIFAAAFLKDILIWLVKVYQKFAPEEVRRKCVFMPSCSEYMILSLEKYGAIKGLIKGIKRLKRCHLPNHGEDYP